MDNAMISSYYLTSELRMKPRTPEYLGHLESKERLRIQPVQLFHFS